MGPRLRAGAAVVLLLCLSSLVFTAPTAAQAETVGDFLMKLARAAGFTPTTPANAIGILVRQKLITASVGNSLLPQVGFELTRGMTSRILVEVMHDTQLATAPTQDIVNTLAQRGIMTAGPPESVVTSEEVTAILTNPSVAAAMSAAIVPVAVAAAPIALPAALGVAAAAAAAAVASHSFAHVSP